jgi:hypothetical protein
MADPGPLGAILIVCGPIVLVWVGFVVGFSFGVELGRKRPSVPWWGL